MKMDEVSISEDAERELSVQPATQSTVAKAYGLGIAGLEEVPVTILPIPFVKVVQPTSQNIEMSDGKTEAPAGTFFFTDTLQAVPELKFVLLKAKHLNQQYKRDGVVTTSMRLFILGVTRGTDKVFILSLSIMSFSNFGRLVAQFNDQKIVATHHYELTATTDLQKNESGKFYVVKFQIGTKLKEEEVLKAEELIAKFSGALDRNQDQE